MTLTYTHFENVESPTGFTSRLEHSDGSIIEIPSRLNEDQSINHWKCEQALVEVHERDVLIRAIIERFHSIDATNVIDRTYMNGTQIRTDYSVATLNGQAIVEKLKETWPDEVASYDNNGMNLVAEYTPTRPPYNNNPNISFYSMDPASPELLESFGAHYNEYMEWYGLKFDTVTNDVILKAVIPLFEMERVYPQTYNLIMDLLPSNHYTYFARIHDKDGNINDNVDVYFQGSVDSIKQWCTSYGYTFPFDINDQNIIKKIFIWGCVYNTTSGELTHVKAYARESFSL